MRPVNVAFIDLVTMKPIYFWVDCYEDYWLAKGRWGFRLSEDDPLTWKEVEKRYDREQI